MKRFYKLVLCIPLLVLQMFVGELHAQPTSDGMAGFVVDVDGQPVVGVTVMLKGAQEGRVTGADGYYRIKAKAGDVVVFSFLGYQDVEVPYAEGTIQNIVLRQASVEIDDVVIVGYGTQKKESVTASIASVAPQRLERVASVSLSNAIGGMIPGVITRQPTGEPGNDQAVVYIRGAGTWENKAPLVLVDGIERDMNIVNPSEIESYTVLKDASSTAVYGVKGANGVILITTKRGKLGKPRVSFRTEMANLHGLRFPEYINGYEFASLMNEAVAHVNGPNSALPWQPDELQKFKDGSDPYLYPSVDWTNEILKRDAFQTINNLSISGGDEVATYYVNVGYVSQEGLFKEDPQYEYRTNSHSNRYNYRSNVDVNLSRDLKVGLGVSGIIEDKTFPGTSSNEIFEWMRRTSPIQMPKQNPDGTPGSGTSLVYANPWALSTQSGYSSHSVTTIQSTFDVDWDLSNLITEGLSFKANFAFDYRHQTIATRYILYEKWRYKGKNADGEDEYNLIQQGSPMNLTINDHTTRTLYYDLGFNYNRSFDDHHVTGMVLFNRRNKTISYPGIRSIDNLPYLRQGVAARFTYEYAGKYMAELNMGYNGSENFPKGQQYGLFPAISGGWVLSEEEFWMGFLPDVYAKIRGSYGIVGNDEIGGDRFLFLSMINTSGHGAYFGESQNFITGYSEYKTGANVTWEKAAKLNGGFELRFFKDRLGLSADFFIENRSDILLRRSQIPITSGIVTATYANLGVVENRGIEANLDFKNTTASGLYYSLYFNYTYAFNKIIENDKPTPLMWYQDERGRRIGQPYGLVAMGFFESQEEIENSPTQKFSSIVRVGDIRYVDINEDGVVDVYDRVPIGYARDPEMMFGFGGTISYKGFDMSLHFTGATHCTTFFNGSDMWPFSLEFPQYNVAREYYDNRFVEGADNSNAKYPAVINGKNTNNYELSTLYMRDASYLKLKNAEIGYTLPQKVNNYLGVSKVRLFLNGTNLLCFDYLDIVDPEADYGTGNYPMQRVVNFGIDVDF